MQLLPELDQIPAQLFSAWSDSDPLEPIGEKILQAAGKADVEPLAQAYLIQQSWMRTRLASGQKIVGKKIGLTSPAVQKQLGVDQPDFGQLLDSMQFASGGQLPVEDMIQPRIEAEMAFVLSRDLRLDPQIDVSDCVSEVLESVAQVVPALEIVDSRIADWRIGICDTVADNASAGKFVLGAPVPTSQLGWTPVDWELCGMALYRGRRQTDADPLADDHPARLLALKCEQQLGLESGATRRLQFESEPVSTGCGAACLGNPLIAAAWLAQTLTAWGEPLRAGEVILTGALGKMVDFRPGDVFAAEIAGFAPVCVEAR